MKACLIVIDMQNDFLDRLQAPERRRLVDNTNALIASFRRAGLKVIWVYQTFKADLSDAFLEMRDKNISVVIEGTHGARLADGMDARSTDQQVLKKRYSAFFETELDSILSEHQPEHLVIAGVNTHACVRMTAIDAYQRDHLVILAEDCIGSPQAHHAEISLAYLKDKIARVMPGEEIARLIG